MDTKITILKSSKYTSIFLVCVALVGLLFRATLYWKIPVEAGEPAGFGDVIELLLYFLILGASGVVLLLSALVALFKNYKSAFKVFIVGVVTPIAYYLLHSSVPRLLF